MEDRQPHFPGTVSPILNGIGQIMLQNNPWTGLFFLAGICFGSLTMGLAAIIAVTIGTLTAMLLKYDKEETRSGLYGFSAALVGVALCCFFQPTFIIWTAVIVGSALATILQHMFIVKKIPAFTFPFILVTWLFLLVFHFYPGLVQPQPASADIFPNNYLAFFSRGFGQVIFQSHIWAGLLFAVGIFISRPLAAVYAMGSIAVSGIIAYLMKVPVNDIYMGLLSYNAVLCAIAFTGRRSVDFLMALLAVVLSVFMMIAMRHSQLPALTFPFVLASWLVLVVKERMGTALSTGLK